MDLAKRKLMNSLNRRITAYIAVSILLGTILGSQATIILITNSPSFYFAVLLSAIVYCLTTNTLVDHIHKSFKTYSENISKLESK